MDGKDRITIFVAEKQSKWQSFNYVPSAQEGRAMIGNAEHKISELERLVRDLQSKVSNLERENRELKSKNDRLEHKVRSAKSALDSF